MESEAAQLEAWMAKSASPAAFQSESPGGLDVARVHRAGAGDSGAQTWLLTRVMQRVRRIARTFLASPADADDAAQTALLAILRSAPTYRGEAAVEAWAGRIELPPKALFRLNLVLEELATNIVVHGYNGGAGKVDVHVIDDGTHVTLTLRDRAVEFDPFKSAPEADLEPSVRQDVR